MCAAESEPYVEVANVSGWRLASFSQRYASFVQTALRCSAPLRSPWHRCADPMEGGNTQQKDWAMLRRGLSRRGFLGQTAAIASSAFLPMPAIAAAGMSNSPSPGATGSQLYVYVARAKGMMKARGIDFGLVAAPSVICRWRRRCRRSRSTAAPKNSPGLGSAFGSTAWIARKPAITASAGPTPPFSKRPNSSCSIW